MAIESIRSDKDPVRTANSEEVDSDQAHLDQYDITSFFPL